MHEIHIKDCKVHCHYFVPQRSLVKIKYNITDNTAEYNVVTS